MLRLIAVLSVLLSACATRPSVRDHIVWDPKTGCYAWDDGFPVTVAGSGKQWCDGYERNPR